MKLKPAKIVVKNIQKTIIIIGVAELITKQLIVAKKKSGGVVERKEKINLDAKSQSMKLGMRMTCFKISGTILKRINRLVAFVVSKLVMIFKIVLKIQILDLKKMHRMVIIESKT